MIKAINNGVRGVMNGLNLASRSTEALTQATDADSFDIASATKSAVDLSRAERQVEASVKVVRRLARMSGSLFDKIA